MRSIKIIVLFITILIFALTGLPAFCYTGLIIDAHGLDVKPSMSPKIYDTRGIEIYGTVNVSPDFVNLVGIIGYANTIKQAIDENLVGEHPLIVRAIRIFEDPVRGSLIIKEEDGKLVMLENMRAGFLHNYKVAIVW